MAMTGGDMGTDPNKVRLTGENSFLLLSEVQGGDPTIQSSHWRVHHSPKGPGHVLFLRGGLTDGRARIYSDNIALARWLQEGIQASMRDTYSGPDLPVIDAVFERVGDTRTFWTERIETAEQSIALTWFDFGEPVAIANAPGENPGQPHGVYSILIPAARAQLTIDGEAAPGRVWPRTLGTAQLTTCCLALSETWTIPRDHEWANEPA
jgi:hypothetical protein